MAAKPELLRELRELTGSITQSNREFWTAPDFPSGVAKGIVTELLGNARTEWLISLFIANPEPYILWCERESAILPTALIQRGLKPHRIQFLNSVEDLYQPLRVALESQHYPFVVAPHRLTDVTAFQRLHLIAEKSKSTIFLLGEKTFSQAWPISLQLEINDSGEGFQILTHRQKHGLSS
jgi:hypothetical protein